MQHCPQNLAVVQSNNSSGGDGGGGGCREAVTAPFGTDGKPAATDDHDDDDDDDNNTTPSLDFPDPPEHQLGDKLWKHKLVEDCDKRIEECRKGTKTKMIDGLLYRKHPAKSCDLWICTRPDNPDGAATLWTYYRKKTGWKQNLHGEMYFDWHDELLKQVMDGKLQDPTGSHNDVGGFRKLSFSMAVMSGETKGFVEDYWKAKFGRSERKKTAKQLPQQQGSSKRHKTDKQPSQQGPSKRQKTEKQPPPPQQGPSASEDEDAAIAAAGSDSSVRFTFKHL
jgi:hypothetical protein